MDVFQKICADKQAKLITVQDISEQVEDKGINFVYDGEEYFISARAHYQVNNAVLAIETVKKLNKENLLNVKKEAIRKGLLTDLPGRFEIISENPKIIIDGAHNVHGIDALLSSLKEDEEYIFVFSALSDKNYKVMLEKLLVWGEVIVTEFESNRKVKALDLALGQDVLICFDYLQAIKYALTKNKILIVTGSLYFISLVRNSFVK